MKKMIFFCFLLLFSVNVKAIECEVIIDADSGRVLGGFNIDKERHIASTTKIMTALVTINNSRLNEIVEIGDEIKSAYGSSIYIKPKEKLRIEDLLYGLMLRSGNDAALSLATHVSGNIPAFTDLMNETAESIGMKNTHFGNPHGLDDKPSNTSTVYDMAILMMNAMKNETFRRITSTKKYITKSNFTTYTWYNKNELLNSYKYATGGKIGYTGEANYTFVSSATKDNKNLIIATFVDKNRFTTHKNLYEKYFNEYEKYHLIDKDNLGINYKKGYRTFTLESFDMLLTKEESKRIKREVELYENVKIQNNAKIVGTISITMDSKTYKKLNIYGESTTKKELWIVSFIKRLFKW